MRFTSKRLNKLLENPQSIESILAKQQQKLSEFSGLKRKLVIAKNKNVKYKFVDERSNKQQQLEIY